MQVEYKTVPLQRGVQFFEILIYTTVLLYTFLKRVMFLVTVSVQTKILFFRLKHYLLKSYGDFPPFGTDHALILGRICNIQLWNIPLCWILSVMQI